MKNRSWIGCTTASLLLLGCSGTAEPVKEQVSAPAQRALDTLKQQVGPDQGNYARLVSTSLADAVQATLPSVVVVNTEATRYFRDYFSRQRYRQDIPTGQGSGFFISDDGYVITNHHVINQAERVTVVLEDGSEYPAKIVGSNAQVDVAVLKVEAPAGTKFPAVTLADSDQVRVGELCLAIGSPFNLSSTVTQGIISHKGRPADVMPLVDFLQTSAPINPGNSGGPLVDVEGRVIGVNTFIQTAQPGVGGNIGIGFAVPSNTARRIAELIISGKNSDLPWVGVIMQDTNYGVYVTEVVKNSPAEKAGVLAGDFVRKIDGKDVTSSDALRTAILLRQPGDAVTAVVLRRGLKEPQNISITTAPMPDLTQYR